MGAFKVNYPFVEEGAGFSLKAINSFLISQVDLH